MPFDIGSLLVQYGYLAVFLTPLIESAGIPLPGETMLIAASAYAGVTGQLDILLVILAAAAGTILGGTGGYLAGRAGGRPLARRYGRYVALTPERLRLLERFFRRHGGKSIFIGRFLSVLRTWLAFTAGVSRMSSGRFLAWNAAGGLIWAFFWGTVTYRLGTVLRGGTIVLLIALGVGALLLIGLTLQGRRLEHLLLDPEEGTTRDG